MELVGWHICPSVRQLRIYIILIGLLGTIVIANTSFLAVLIGYASLTATPPTWVLTVGAVIPGDLMRPRNSTIESKVGVIGRKQSVPTAEFPLTAKESSDDGVDANESKLQSVPAKVFNTYVLLMKIAGGRIRYTVDNIKHVRDTVIPHRPKESSETRERLCVIDVDKTLLVVYQMESFRLANVNVAVRRLLKNCGDANTNKRVMLLSTGRHPPSLLFPYLGADNSVTMITDQSYQMVIDGRAVTYVSLDSWWFVLRERTKFANGIMLLYCKSIFLKLLLNDFTKEERSKLRYVYSSPTEGSSDGVLFDTKPLRKQGLWGVNMFKTQLNLLLIGDSLGDGIYQTVRSHDIVPKAVFVQFQYSSGVSATKIVRSLNAVDHHWSELLEKFDCEHLPILDGRWIGPYGVANKRKIGNSPNLKY